LLEAVHRGVDMFDCILPTALARQGVAFTSLGRRDLRRAAYRGAAGPIDPACGCYTCQTFSIGYLFHLNRLREPQGWQLLGLHNLHFYLELMRAMREHILAGTWCSFYRAQREVLDARDRYGPEPTHVTKAERYRRSLYLGAFEVVVGGEHAHIRDSHSGEVMHPVSDPSGEARRVYVEQARLAARLGSVAERPLVVWDVGLGAGANAMAAIEAAEGTGGRRLTLVSFERDLDALKLALRHPRWFEHLRHPAPHRLLEAGEWHGAAVDWYLESGDFRETRGAAPAPDLVFFDPFSYKTDRELWTLESFRALAGLWPDRAVELFTYSYSTSVRAAMLAAGFYVARGVATGPRRETTIALTAVAAALRHERELLGSPWLDKWRRSDARVPLGADPADPAWQAAITGHPQFLSP
jgi:queuine tRNA-ribosyltransferase